MHSRGEPPVEKRYNPMHEEHPEPQPENADASEAENRDPSPEPERPREVGGRDGPEPTRFGDWEKNGRCIDF